VVDDINAALAAVREASTGEDVALLRERIGALSNASMKIGESLAQQSGGSSGSSGSGGGGDSGSSGSGGGASGSP
jgi:molecular chaperone DnaK